MPTIVGYRGRPLKLKKSTKPRQVSMSALTSAMRGVSLVPGLRRRRPAAAAVLRRRKNPMIRKIVKGTLGGRPSFSKWSTGKKASPRVSAMKKVGAPNYYVTNSSAQIKIAEGFQNAQSMSFQGLTDLKQIRSYAFGTPSVPQPTRQFLLESSTCEYLITNSTLATMYVDIYDVVRKRNQTGVAPYQTSTPDQAWAAGVYDESSGDTTGWQVPNSLPTDSRLFKDFFKVVQRNHIALGQGDTHRHHLKLNSNDLLDDALLNAADGDLAGISVYTMIVAYGQPSSVEDETGATLVTTAGGAIDVIATKRYKYTYVQDSTSNFYAVDNLSTLVGEKIVSRGAGVIVPNSSV